MQAKVSEWSNLLLPTTDYVVIYKIESVVLHSVFQSYLYSFSHFVPFTPPLPQEPNLIES